MSCQAFREAILEATGETLTPEERSPSGHLQSDHLVECSACQAYVLQHEQALQQIVEDLRLLAEADAAVEAPAVVEAHLLAACQAQRTERRRASDVWWGRRWAHPGLLVGGAIAAALLLASLPLVQRFRPSGQRVSPTSGAVSLGNPVPLAEPPRPILSTGEDRPQTPPPRRARRDRRPTRPVMPLVTAPPAHHLATAVEGAIDDRQSDEEWVTDFFPLNAGQSLFPIERGRLIRMVVPRSLLGTFGLSVHPDWAMVPIKADIVIGEDGAAQAVRFVRDEP